MDHRGGDQIRIFIIGGKLKGSREMLLDWRSREQECAENCSWRMVSS